MSFLNATAPTAPTTPEDRIAIYNSLQTEDVYNRLKYYDPNDLRCLFENFQPDRGIENCHLVPRRKRVENFLLDRLEWHWYLRRNSLNLDTRYNIFRAGAAVHDLFDRRRFLLIPDIKYVNIYEDHVADESKEKRKEFPNLVPIDKSATNVFYEYKILPIDMHNLPLFRERHLKKEEIDDTKLLEDAEVTGEAGENQTPEEDIKLLTTNDYDTYVNANLSEFPVVKSHVHPVFAIVAAGDSLRHLQRDTTTASVLEKIYEEDKKGILKKILFIYDGWCDRVPPEATSDKQYNRKSTKEEKEAMRKKCVGGCTEDGRARNLKRKYYNKGGNNDDVFSG